MTGVSRERLLSDLRDIDTEPERLPTISSIRVECEGTVRDYISEFGTWYDALEAASLTDGISPPVADKEELIADLQRVESEIGRSPTGDHLTEHGEYDTDTYELVFGSYLLALEAAGIDPETRQYNFGEVDPPKNRDTTKNVRHLREHGPTPSSEMPLGSSVSDREHGMWRFVMTSGQGSTDSGGATEAVYYLDDQHDAESILRTFFETNDSLVRNKSRHGITLGVRDHNPNWVDTATDLLDEIEASSRIEGDTEVGILAVNPTDDTLSQAVTQTVKTAATNIDIIDGVEADSGYVLGMPEEQEALWNCVNIGDIVLIRTGDEIYAFTVDQTVLDWNATSELWAQYDDGVRAAGPDRPWPYLLVGNTGTEVDIDVNAFWDTVPVDETSDQFQYVPEESLADLRAKHGTVWQFLSAESDNADNVSERPRSNATTTEATPDSSIGSASGDSESTTVEIDPVIAFLASEKSSEDIASFVGEHLKQAVDGTEPTVSAVTSASTTEVLVELTDTQRTLINALCGADGDYASVDAFVEDALRTRMEIPDSKEEFSVLVDGPTSAVLKRIAETEGRNINEILSTQIAEMVHKVQ